MVQLAITVKVVDENSQMLQPSGSDQPDSPQISCSHRFFNECERMFNSATDGRAFAIFPLLFFSESLATVGTHAKARRHLKAPNKEFLHITAITGIGEKNPAFVA